MKYTLYIQYRNGEKAATSRKLQVSLATLADKDTIVAFFSDGKLAGELVADTIHNAEILMLRDGILLTGYEDANDEGTYYIQRWWLTEPEVTK